LCPADDEAFEERAPNGSPEGREVDGRERLQDHRAGGDEHGVLGEGGHGRGRAGLGNLRDLRIAEVAQLDMHLEDGKVAAYRAKVKVSFKYEGS
jgi:hypothetical protein